MLAGHELWKNADVVLAIGTRLNQPQTRWGTDADLKLIRVDLDPVELTRIVRPAIGIVADAGDAAAALLKAVDGGPARSSRRAELDGLKAKTAALVAERLGPQCEYLA